MRGLLSRSVYVSFVLLISLALGACGGDGGESPNNAAGSEADGGAAADETESGDAEGLLSETTSLAVGHHSGGGMLPFYYPWGVAPAFWEDNLDVAITPGESPEQMQQLLAGNIEVGHPGPTQVFNAIQDGYQDDFRVIGTWLYRQGFELKVNADSPIEDFEDLAERAQENKMTIGISEMGGGEVPLIHAAFAFRDLVEGEHYELLPIGDGGAQTAEALKADQVDAYATANKDFIGLSVFGLDLRDISPGEWGELTANVFVVRTETLEEKPEAVAAYMRGLVKAVLLTHEDPQAALDIMKERFPEGFVEFEDEFSLGWMDLTEPRILVDGATEAKSVFEPDVDGLINYRDFLVKLGELEEGLVDEAALDALIDPSIVQIANDFDYSNVAPEAQG